jgi:hypothetical protein
MLTHVAQIQPLADARGSVAGQSRRRVQGARLVGERSDRHGGVHVGNVGSEFLANGGLVTDYFAVDEDGFGGYETADTPAGDRHPIDQLQFGGSGGLMDGDMFGEEFREVLRVSQCKSIVQRAVWPCLREFLFDLMRRFRILSRSTCD